MTRPHGCSRLAGVRNRTRAGEGDCRSVRDTRASHPKPSCSLPSIRPPTRTSRSTARAVPVRLPAPRPEQGVSEIDPRMSSTDAPKVARGCPSRHQGPLSLESAPGTVGPVAPIREGNQPPGAHRSNVKNVLEPRPPHRLWVSEAVQDGKTRSRRATATTVVAIARATSVVRAPTRRHPAASHRRRSRK